MDSEEFSGGTKEPLEELSTDELLEESIEGVEELDELEELLEEELEELEEELEELLEELEELEELSLETLFSPEGVVIFSGISLPKSNQAYSG